MKKIVVIGSINMDLVTICERAPRGGETLLGKKFVEKELIKLLLWGK